MSGGAQAHRWSTPAQLSHGAISAAIADPIQKRGPGKLWFYSLLATLPFVLVTLGAIGAER